MIRQFLKALPAMGRRKKRTILVAYDLTSMVFALWAAFSTRLGIVFIPYSRSVVVAAAASFIVGLAALYRLRIYHIVLRYFDLRAVTRILSAAAVAAIAWITIVYVVNPRLTIAHVAIEVPRSVGFIYFGFLFLLLFMGRYLMAVMLAGVDREGAASETEVRKIAIYGANTAGISLADSVRLSPRFHLAGFIDPDPAVHGQIIAGTRIHSPDFLPQLASSGQVDEVFLALPKATRSQRLDAISRIRDVNLEVKTVPAPEEIVSGRFTVSDIRPIDVGDLLRRDPVEPLSDLIGEAVEGHSILITGAGGSIGSEICRQVIHGRPARLVLLDHSEFALYSIDDNLREVAEQMPIGDRPEIVPIVGSMIDDRLVRETIAENGIDTLYHAAAYKHVPLLEHNELVGIANNVFGTLSVARAAFDSELARFTMISTDKAVRPKSIMGASKRIAELIVQAFASDDDCVTRFGIVRFGNVLDSSGSVVQRFRKQIRAGGPVTVTHKEITRFFMSIPEATQLVLQASAMASKGEVFVLDMGEPVKITELARHMINLSGMTVRDDENPMGDVEIQFVGLRPGEKLHEELFLGHDTLATIHPRIKMARERVIPIEELEQMVVGLREALESRDRERIRSAVAEFIWPEQQEPKPADSRPRQRKSGTDG